MTVMTRQRALTILTDDLYIGDVIYFKSPCFRALFIRDGVKGYARKLHPKGYLFIADEEDHVQFHNGFSLISDDSMPDVLWFKETDDKITRYEGLYI